MCITAGARLVSEDCFVSEQNSGQWSKHLLGGKPLACDGISLKFAPIFEATFSGEGSPQFIGLTIEKKEPKSVAPPKRTPFEVKSYIEAAWARPDYVPLSQGPGCLRVLGPMPHMIVTNLTDAMVNGKTLEGTVNRILLQLEAGPGESCFDIEYKLSCSTTIVSSDGSTTHLPPSSEGEEDVKTVGSRTPVLVSQDEAGTGKRSTDYGYDLPPGWRLEGTGHDSDKVEYHVRNLQAGESTYICFELYRPACSLKPLENPYDGEGISADESKEDKICQTNFDISISYRQSRPAIQKARDERNQSELSDSVVLEHSGSVVWESPLLADFFVDGRSQRAFPSGSRHPSNYVSSGMENTGSAGAAPELALINGERTSAKCVLQSNVAGDGLGIEIARIGFEVRRLRNCCFKEKTRSSY